MRNIITLFLLAVGFAATAQNTEVKAKGLHAFSTLGLSFVDNDYKPASGNSVQTTTGMEYSFSRSSSLGIALSFDSYGYQKETAAYDLDGSLKTTGLALFFRQKFTNGTWQPYLKAGGGTAWVSLPTVSVEQAKTNIRKETQNVGMAMAEAGVQVHVLPRYSLLIAAEKKWLGKSTLADNKSLGTTGFKVGIISSF